MKERGAYKAEINFEDRKAIIQGKDLTSDTSSAMAKECLAAFDQARNEYNLNWHLDLETFALLPLAENKVFQINFYEAGYPTPPKWETYAVVGPNTFTGFNNVPVDCWLLKHVTGQSEEVFWVSKEIHEVLKLKQKQGDQYRFKIKLECI